MASQPVHIARPWPALGIGWLIAVLVLLLAILDLIGGVHVAEIWLVLGLALAILL